MKNNIIHMARRELHSLFASPIAYIFIAAFLGVTLFVFFWGESFFARNIADVRPLFEWMPILLIFLVSALTMRMWAEERRSGTLEFLLTLPVSLPRLVLGKFIACLALVAIALALTFFLPLSVAYLGTLDFGPVLGGYIAALLLAAAYISVGLYVSSRTDNQIVSLLITALICSFFYLLGSGSFTALFGSQIATFFQLIGTGSRFASITRGVLDFRDLYYYASIVAVFLALNIFSLEKIRWTEKKTSHHGFWKIATLLAAVNILLANFWLQPVQALRLDLTGNQRYTISEATKNYLSQLQEPLLIRGYFSKRTHPLLAPLVPQMKDLIAEYALAGRGKVQAEFLDPKDSRDVEKEAGERYGIKPVPFQVADRYQQSLVNSYFDVLIEYGNKFEVLKFQDLIEASVRSEARIDVKLENPEYDLTRAIKKVLYGFQGLEQLFESIDAPVELVIYRSADNKMPRQILELNSELEALVKDMQLSAQGKLTITTIDPEAEDGKVAKDIAEQFGIRPVGNPLLNIPPFYYSLLLRQNERVVQVSLPEDLSKDALRRSLETSLKRFASGFTRRLALVSPPAPAQNPYMPQMMPSGKNYRLLQEKLGENYEILHESLDDGVVADNADLLVILSPRDLSEKAVFAVDQFLMKGGTVLLASSGYDVARNQSTMAATKINTGLEAWLKNYGITLQDGLVLDKQNEPYPVPMDRNVGGFTIQEIHRVPYPYFVEVRGNGIDSSSGLTAGVAQMTMNWARPIEIDKEKNKDRSVHTLLRSSADSWTAADGDLIPNYALYKEFGFATPKPTGPFTLGAVVEGQFTSLFAGKDSPLNVIEDEAQATPEGEKKKDEKKEPKTASHFGGVLEKSTSSARIILFSSSDFVEDQALSFSASDGSTQYVNALQLVENAVDWSLEDRGLLGIRSRSNFSNTLRPVSRGTQLFIEYGNYALAILGLLALFLLWRTREKLRDAQYEHLLKA